MNVGCCIADMDAGDIAYVIMAVSGGSRVVSYIGGDYAGVYSYFCGKLAC